jgi:transposase-like protein
MAEDRRMTAAQVVDKVMGCEHADVVRESVAWVVGELMEAEVAAQIGAELGEVSPERVTHRNGYRPRPWQTRAGEIELAIPKLRSGSYFPSFLEPRKRSEQALVAGRPGGLRQRRLDQKGRPARRAARCRRDGQGRGLAVVPWAR